MQGCEKLLFRLDMPVRLRRTGISIFLANPVPHSSFSELKELGLWVLYNKTNYFSIFENKKSPKWLC